MTRIGFFVYCTYVLTLINLFSCNNTTESNKGENFILLEVQRNTPGVALDDSAGWLSICCNLYKFEYESLSIFDPEFKNDEEIKILCLTKHTLQEEVGLGTASKVISILKLPTVIPLLTYFWSEDSLEILTLNERGVISLRFMGRDVELRPYTNWTWSDKKDVEIIVGSFQITDEFKFINYGPWTKERVISN